MEQRRFSFSRDCDSHDELTVPTRDALGFYCVSFDVLLRSRRVNWYSPCTNLLTYVFTGIYEACPLATPNANISLKIDNVVNVFSILKTCCTNAYLLLRPKK